MRAWGVFIAAVLVLPGFGSWSATFPADATVLHGRQADRLLSQCSRDTPKLGEASWQPGPDDILTLEAVLPAALKAKAPRGDTDWSNVPTGWRRQYAGFVLHGHRVIYGNFLPNHTGDNAWRVVAQMVCDGGPAFFGVLYDVADHRILHLAFNGYA